MNTADRFKYLLTRYLSGDLANKERGEFFDLLATGFYDDILETQIIADTYADDLKPDTTITAQVADDMLKKIMDTDRGQKNGSRKKNFYKQPLFFLASAAAVVLIVSVAVYWYMLPMSNQQFLKEFVASNPNQTINTTNKPMPVILPDGSLITLQPQSSLYFALNTFKCRRVVYMQGEAVFNITRNPKLPFYVYYHKVVTKVLGTSFKIRMNNLTGNVEVEVFTGKVKVYENEKMATAGRHLNEIIVTPNHKAIYKDTRRLFETALVDHPLPIADNENQKEGNMTRPLNFIFENEKMAGVIKNLEQNYGIEITVSNAAIYQCVFSGDITKEDLYNKLKVLCTATNSEYEVDGTKILIKGNGCN